MIRHGHEPFLECSSAGDKRFSAMYARLPSRGNQTIESLYQAAKIFANGDTGLTIKQAKGWPCKNPEEVRALYRQLWREYLTLHPDYLVFLTTQTGLSDRYGQVGHVCQASELWYYRCFSLPREQALADCYSDNGKCPWCFGQPWKHAPWCPNCGFLDDP